MTNNVRPVSHHYVKSMNVYLIKPKNDEKPPFNNWDIACGFVVIAESPIDARKLIYDAGYLETYGSEGKDVWMDKNLTSCSLIATHAFRKPGIILRDFKAG